MFKSSDKSSTTQIWDLSGTVPKVIYKELFNYINPWVGDMPSVKAISGRTKRVTIIDMETYIRQKYTGVTRITIEPPFYCLHCIDGSDHRKKLETIRSIDEDYEEE